MSRKYRMHDPGGVYFISFATINWIDVFVREDYFSIIVESLNHCIENKGMTVYAYCIMPSHVHMIFRDKNDEPSKLLQQLKTHTSKKIRKAIEDNPQESRKEWILWMMKRAGSKTKEGLFQLWQHHNQPIELWSNSVFSQKLDYIHNNPVASGFVSNPGDWKYSSAINYEGKKGLVKVEIYE